MCSRCGGLLLTERLHDLGGSVIEAIEVQRCVACSRLYEPGRAYGVMATGDTGSDAGQVKGSGRYLNCVGKGPAWTAPNLSDVEE